MRISDWSSDVCSSDVPVKTGDKLMLADVQSSYGLARPFQGVGNFETEHQRNLVREVCAAVQTGRLIVVSGLVGSGKTHLLRRIEDELARADRKSVGQGKGVAVRVDIGGCRSLK